MADNRLMHPPKAILMATDLGSHSDRALDRAVQLADQWQARLHILHVQPPETRGFWWAARETGTALTDNDIEDVKQQIRRDLREPVADLSIHVEEGETAPTILAVAEREQCELIVVGVGAPEFAEIVPSTTAARLLRRSSRSVLLVKSRPHSPYHNMLVGTDFTPESRQGLETAAAWFNKAEFAVLHALDVPYQSLLSDAERGEALTRLEQETMQRFVAEARLDETVRQRLETHIEHGYPEAILRKYGGIDGATLIVIGALRRSLMFRIFIGDDASRIMRLVPGDVLMVRSAS